MQKEKVDDMNTTHAIQNPGIKNCPSFLGIKTKQKSQGFLKSMSHALHGFFNRHTGKDLDYETWRHIEFRDEQKPRRPPPLDVGRWF